MTAVNEQDIYEQLIWISKTTLGRAGFVQKFEVPLLWFEQAITVYFPSALNADSVDISRSTAYNASVEVWNDASMATLVTTTRLDKNGVYTISISPNACKTSESKAFSASFLAEIPLRSPRKLFIFII